MDSRRNAVGHFSSEISSSALTQISAVFLRSFRDSNANTILTVSICDVRVVKSSRFNNDGG